VAAITHLENHLDVAFAHFLKKQRLRVFISIELGRAMLKMFGQIALIIEITGRGDLTAGNRGFRVTNVARQRMLQKDCLVAAS
jgi:hypothetical protein